MSTLPRRTVRIGMLNSDTPVPKVLSRLGSYGAIFHRLLSEAAARVAPHVEIQSEQFDVVQGEYPARADDFDLFVISGSAASAYDDADWIQTQEAFLKSVYSNHPRVKLFGSCFGHQLLCQALLGEYGAVVEKDPGGWEIGLHAIQLTPEFRTALGKVSGLAVSPQRPPTPHDDIDDNCVAGEESVAAKQGVVRLQFVHADHVRLPQPPQRRLPTGWILVGSTEHCAVQGVYLPGRVLTYQGHFEFDRFVNAETLRVFGAAWEPQVLRSALDQIESGEDDAAAAADMVVRFLLEERVPEDGERLVNTPPMSDSD